MAQWLSAPPLTPMLPGSNPRTPKTFLLFSTTTEKPFWIFFALPKITHGVRTGFPWLVLLVPAVSFPILFQMRRLISCLSLLIGISHSLRSRRQAALATEDGIDVPISLRSIITCWTPGIRENLCFGPRLDLFRREKLGLSERDGAAYGYRNGIDLRLLKPYNIPLIEDKTEIGHSLGAAVDVTSDDGVVEFGNRGRAFKVFKSNTGGLVEWDRQGAGVDVGTRVSAADDLVKVKVTNFGINVGPNASRSLVGPHTTPRGKGEALKPDSNVVPLIYPGYYNQPGDWYRNQFRRPGDEYRTPAQRGCPWCFATDPSYPVQKLFP